ncbi:MAG TPA: ATP synthase F1 subunit delta [Chitinophagaceae bacterium]|jgi:F-type H+-transporting ATPase subunit delta|nr:ATP synthase F1 subunit delta [Chitinophagaceae bacterium]
MPNPRLAGRYAKSLIDLATEQQQLETVYKDMQFLQSICRNNPEFVKVLRSPVVNSDKKQSILSAITDGRISTLTALFNKLLISKTREEYIPEIVTAFIAQYNEIKEIHTVKLTTATPVSEEVKNAVVAKIKAETSLQNIELETSVREELIGGFVLEFNNNLVDASIERDLRDIKKQFSQNIYIQQIR